MDQPTLLLSVFFAVISAGIYGYIGWPLSKRVISATEARLAWGLCTVGWYGLIASALIGGFLSLFGAFGLTSLSLLVTATYLYWLILNEGPPR